MGLDLNGVMFLLHALEKGADLSRTATIGRQELSVGKEGLRNAFERFGFRVTSSELDSLVQRSGPYAERVFRALGCRALDSFDVSDYEDVNKVVDMNEPIPDECKEAYSVVFDGGALEHIFNFPVALKNCMDMAAVGGHFISITPANNMFGHGFYQFSPELFFRSLSLDNGFEMIDLMVYEDQPGGRWYSVADPSDVGGRVTLLNRTRVLMLVLAKKARSVDVFSAAPQQSDYVSRWEHDEPGTYEEMDNSGNAGIKRNVGKALPGPLKRIARALLGGRRPEMGFDPRFFTEVEPGGSDGKPQTKTLNLD